MLPVMQAVDAAERRGDALEAIHLVNAHPYDADGRLFWRLERLRRLSQLAGLQGLLPRWATSRWILAQAAQHLDQPNRHRTSRAMHVATRARPSVPGGASRHEQQEQAIRIQDRDWVFRQVFLYELGGLAHFVDEVAPPDLLVGADRIVEWALAPLSAFRFLAASGGALTWERLDTAEVVETIDIGSATLLEPGDCALGRMVPIEEGWMFESAPLAVPEQAAARVAVDPGCWVEVVAEASRQQDADGNAACYTGGHDFGLLTDVPVVVQHLLLLAAADRRGPRPELTPETMPGLATAFVLDALDGALDDAAGADGASPWPTVAETLCDNTARGALLARLEPADAPRLLALAGRVGGPAVGVCQRLAAALAEAA